MGAHVPSKRRGAVAPPPDPPRLTVRDGHALVVDPATSARMATVRQRDTSAEQAVAAVVRALGHRYRKQNRDLPGSPDLANRARGWALFVHGCFWHRHEGCPKATTPKRNAEFWRAKFARNVARDASALEALGAAGYRACVVWECEVADSTALRRRLAAWLGSPLAVSLPRARSRARSPGARARRR